MQVDPSSAPRVVELDALRGLAALAVVGFHYTTQYEQFYGHQPALPVSFGFGNYGVQLFFLISGFVIFMTLERTRTALDFVVSRFSRLFPAYWAAILVSATAIYAIGMPSQQLPWQDIALDFTMIQDILGGRHLDGSYWTLEVELFFYVQMLFWFSMGLLARIRWIILAWLVLAVAYGLATKFDRHFSYWTRELLILRHIPFFALGILFYRIRTYPAEWRIDAALVVLTLASIAIAYPSEYAIVGLVCTAIFTAFVRGGLVWLRAAPFAFFGTISYSLYLLHQAIGFSLIWQFERIGVGSMFAAMLAVLVVIALATLLTFFVERPALRLIRDAWKRRRERRQPALAALAAGIIPLFAPEAAASERRGSSTPAMQTASARLGHAVMDEPHRSLFAALIRGGAASQDIHGAPAVAFAASDGFADEAYLAREIGRVEAHRRSLLPLLEAHLGSTPSILDVGCNTGGTTLALALSEHLDARSVVGVDPNAAAVEAARVRQRGHGIDDARVRFEAIAAGEPLPFADGAFDLVTVVSVLEFVGTRAAREAFAREIERVTCRGGHVFVATPNPWRLRELHSRRWFGDLRHRDGFPWASSAPAIRRLFAGFDQVPTDRHVATALFARHRLPGPGPVAPWVVATLPWQKHLFRKR